MGCAIMDFRKSVDSMEHSATWRALEQKSISTQYIGPLKKMYDGQSATVATDVKSDRFHVSRSTTQGGLIEFVVVQLGPCKVQWKKILKNGHRRGLV